MCNIGMCKNCTMQYILWLLIELMAHVSTNDRKIDEVLDIIHIGFGFRVDRYDCNASELVNEIVAEELYYKFSHEGIIHNN